MNKVYLLTETHEICFDVCNCVFPPLGILLLYFLFKTEAEDQLQDVGGHHPIPDHPVLLGRFALLFFLERSTLFAKYLIYGPFFSQL